MTNEKVIKIDSSSKVSFKYTIVNQQPKLEVFLCGQILNDKWAFLQRYVEQCLSGCELRFIDCDRSYNKVIPYYSSQCTRGHSGARLADLPIDNLVTEGTVRFHTMLCTTVGECVDNPENWEYHILNGVKWGFSRSNTEGTQVLKITKLRPNEIKAVLKDFSFRFPNTKFHF